MKLKIQKSSERGRTQLDWLESRHSFSFGEYYNKAKMNFGKLRVLNDDIIWPGMGFGMHPHSNMEIVSIVLEGALEHKDSLENHGIIKAGEIQRMSAGSGVVHSEFNHSKAKSHFLQIWIEPEKQNIKPEYEQRKFDNIVKNKFVELISPNGVNSMKISQNSRIMLGNFEKGNKSLIKNEKGIGTYVFVIGGVISIDSLNLDKGDSAEITQDSVEITSKLASQILAIQVPI